MLRGQGGESDQSARKWHFQADADQNVFLLSNVCIFALWNRLHRDREGSSSLFFAGAYAVHEDLYVFLMPLYFILKVLFVDLAHVRLEQYALPTQDAMGLEAERHQELDDKVLTSLGRSFLLFEFADLPDERRALV